MRRLWVGECSCCGCTVSFWFDKEKDGTVHWVCPDCLFSSFTTIWVDDDTNKPVAGGLQRSVGLKYYKEEHLS